MNFPGRVDRLGLSKIEDLETASAEVISGLADKLPSIVGQPVEEQLNNRIISLLDLVNTKFNETLGAIFAEGNKVDLSNELKNWVKNQVI